MAAQNQSWLVYRGEDALIVLTGADGTNPAGWGLAAYVSAGPGAAPLPVAPSVTAGGTGPYTLTVALSRAQTLGLPAACYLDVWRTDPGSNERLAGGLLTVATPVRGTA